MLTFLLLASLIPQGPDAKHLVEVNFWSGEYPGPIIHVTKPVTVSGFKATKSILIDLKKPVPTSCKIPAGFYHPWANSNLNQIPKTNYEFWTVWQTHDFKYVKKEPFEFYTESGKTLPLKSGDLVSTQAYLSEGMCRVLLRRGKKQLPGDMYCPGEPEYKQVTTRKEYSQQFLKVKCLDSKYPIWLVESANLFKIEGIVEGDIAGYGKIGPKKKDNL